MADDGWHLAVAVDDFPEEGKLAQTFGDWHVLVLRHEGEFFAYNDCCTHQASRLSTGRVRRGTIMCPLHGARFKIGTGENIGGGYSALRQFPVRVEDGMLHVQLPDSPPGPGEDPLG